MDVLYGAVGRQLGLEQNVAGFELIKDRLDLGHDVASDVLEKVYEVGLYCPPKFLVLRRDAYETQLVLPCLEHKK